MMDIYPSSTDDRAAHIRAVEEALISAITDMEYESMLQVMKHILALRTHLDERVMIPDMSLGMVFKMAFAREQGVNVEEVYDPVAYAGLTDSQIAATNLVNDMQRSFHIRFSEDETDAIHTLKDLVAAIIAKRIA